LKEEVVKYVVFLVVSITILGCVSAPSGETSRFSLDSNMNDSISLIDEYTSVCWTIPASISNDDISTRKTREGDKIVFTIGRDNSDIPFMPFARIILLPSPQPVTVSIEEGSVSMAEPWDVDLKLKKWLAGDKSC
ncbi:hypothetical protein, partial [Alteromonas sp. W364]|uniref:hypothetical protein n=1 Tax=Alteromonas sp. W364 TaxID=3075610 RepID=UPI00288883CC